MRIKDSLVESRHPSQAIRSSESTRALNIISTFLLRSPNWRDLPVKLHGRRQRITEDVAAYPISLAIVVQAFLAIADEVAEGRPGASIWRI